MRGAVGRRGGLSYALRPMAAGELYAFGWIGSVLLSTAIASSKNRSGCGWLAMGVGAGPVGLIVHPAVGGVAIAALLAAAVLLPARPPPDPAPPAAGDDEMSEDAETPADDDSS